MKGSTGEMRRVSAWTMAVAAFVGGVAMVAVEPPSVASAAATWSTPVDLSAAGKTANFAQVAMSADGTKAIAVWSRFDRSEEGGFFGNDYNTVQAATATMIDGTLTWSAPTDVGTAIDANYPQVALSANGTMATVVWVESNADYNGLVRAASATIADNTATWSSPVALATRPNVSFPQVGVSSNGTRATAMWSSSSAGGVVVEAASATIVNNSATWSEVTVVSDATQSSSYPQVGVSSDGSRATAVWQSFNGANTIVQSANATITGADATWSEPVGLSASGQSASFPQVGVSSDGLRATAVWSRSDGFHYIVQSASAAIVDVTATWSTPVDLSAAGRNADGAQVDVSSDGSKATAVWTRSDGTNVIVQSTSAAIAGNAATWSTPAVNLSLAGANADYPHVSVSGNGRTATAIWKRFDGSHTIVQTATAAIAGNAATWSTPAVDLSAIGGTGDYPQVAVSADGTTAAAVWQRFDGSAYRVQSSWLDLPKAVAVQGLGYWKNVNLTTPPLPIPLGQYSVSTQARATAVFKATNCGKSGSDAIGCLAGQLLVAKLNVSAGAPASCIVTHRNDADDLLTAVGYSGPGAYRLNKAQRASAIVLTTALSSYNTNGCL